MYMWPQLKDEDEIPDRRKKVWNLLYQAHQKDIKTTL